MKFGLPLKFSARPGSGKNDVRLSIPESVLGFVVKIKEGPLPLVRSRVYFDPESGRFQSKYGGIVDADELTANLRISCISESMIGGDVPEYDDFLEERRKLMALKMKVWFGGL